MAAPTVAARSTGRTTTTNTTSHAITMPSGIVVGNLLLVVFSSDGSPTCTASAGWTKLGQASNGTAVTGAVFWKYAVGGDTCTVTTSASEQSSHVVLRITGTTGTPTGTAANASGTNSNPPSHSALVLADHLWVATRSGDSTTVATAAPASYATLQSIAAAGTGGASTNTAERTVTASLTEDPGTFTSATAPWVSWTLAVPPADPAITYVGKGTESLVASNTANTPGLPAGLQDGDLMVLLYGMTSWAGTANEPATPSGWTKKASTLSATTGGRLSWYYRRYQSGDAAPTLAYSGTTSDIRFTQIFAFRGVVASGDPADVLGTASNNGVQKDMGPISGVTTTAAGIVLVAGVRESDWQPGGGLTVLSGDGLAWNEICDREDFATEPGDNIGLGLDYALMPGAMTVTDKTFTIDTGNTAPAIGQMWALLPVGPGGGSTPVSGSDSASATDSGFLSAATAPADSVGVADSASVSATSAASDQAAVSDSAGVAATGTTTDTASVIELVQLAVVTAGSDAAAITDAASVAAEFTTSDPATTTDSAALTVQILATDGGLLTESASVEAGAVPITGADGGAVGESTVLQASAGGTDGGGALDESAVLQVLAVGTDAATVGETALVSVQVASSDSATLAGESGSALSAGMVLQRLTGAVAVIQRLGGTTGISDRLAGSTNQVAGSVAFADRVNGAASPASRLVGSASVPGRTAGALETNRVGGTVDYA
ncbi:hypothetical protein OU415_02385 [Saccharopolyspora sp. WRP15-2]|uniref:Uncharacterized protein n=1 Tax=Saccharopolyspora oryzae TaxID=2997343 RepID=A0ABT4URB9_9PSEU|nr:hypothetical protein [Saccharopolyspora oryzae]MDA3624265.1 hypothetical protein [Saccharopolyspora oryzae]